jgi:mannose-6-phosphate isomerase-like protein (cupin superfamily)
MKMPPEMTPETITPDTDTDTGPPPKIVGPSDGESVSLGAIGARFIIDTDETHEGGFSLVEHPLPPRALAAPLHRHSREDEYSWVIEGRMGALLGDEVVFAEPEDLVFKPRDQWHTFWNAGDEPCRILEIIAPGGFEDFFKELGGKLAGDMDPAEAPAFFGEMSQKYGIDFDPEATPPIAEEHGLWHPIFAPKK